MPSNVLIALAKWWASRSKKEEESRASGNMPVEPEPGEQAGPLANYAIEEEEEEEPSLPDWPIPASE